MIHVVIFNIYIKQYKAPQKKIKPLTPEELQYLSYMQHQEEKLKRKMDYLQKRGNNAGNGSGSHGNSLFSSKANYSGFNQSSNFPSNNLGFAEEMHAFGLMKEEVRKNQKFILNRKLKKKEEPKHIEKIRISGQAIITKSMKKPKGRGLTKSSRKKVDCPKFFGGLGFTYDPGSQRVLKVISNSPASEFLHPNDIIVGVEDKGVFYSDLRHIIGSPFSEINVIYYRGGMLHKYLVERNKICYDERLPFQS